MIIGNLGSRPGDALHRRTALRSRSFSVATNRRYKTGDGEQREEVVWFRVSAWNRLAEVTNEYLHKGSQVYVEGRIAEPRVYTTQSGEARASLDVNAQTVQFLSTSNSDNGHDAGEPVGAQSRTGGAAPPRRRASRKTKTTCPGRRVAGQ